MSNRKVYTCSNWELAMTSFMVRNLIFHRKFRQLGYLSENCKFKDRTTKIQPLYVCFRTAITGLTTKPVLSVIVAAMGNAIKLLENALAQQRESLVPLVIRYFMICIVCTIYMRAISSPLV